MAAIKKARRSRSQFRNMDDLSRQLVYDQAKSRMQQAQTHAVQQRAHEQAAGEQQRAAARVGNLEKMPKVQPDRPQVPLGQNRNNTGNARQGLLFRTRQVKGGVQHVYNNGTRVFVREPRPVKTGETVAPGAQAIAKQRAKTVAGQVVPSNVPRPGQGAGVMRRLSRKSSRRRA